MPRILLGAIGLAAILYTGAVLLVQQRGLRAEYFASEQLGGTPVISAIDDQISTQKLARRWYGVPPTAFSVQWSGYLTVARPGRYTFAITSDDAGFLSVDGQRLVENGGQHEALTATADIVLARGSHAVLIEYSQSGGAYALEWAWARDGGALTAVPGWSLTPYRVASWRVLTARAMQLAAFGFALAAFLLLVIISWRGRAAVARHPRWATLGLFVALAILHTWPIATDPGHLTRHDNRDSMLNEWIVAWVAHQGLRDPLHLFDANIFYPARNTLAYSEPMIPQAAMGAPLFALGASPVLVYNLLLLAGFALTGWSMCLVIRSWTGDWTAGLVSGAIFAFNGHALTRIPHLQALHVEFLPPALFALDALLQRPDARRAVRLAIWSTLQALASIYLLVFTVFAIAAAILARPSEWAGKRFIPFMKALTTSGVVAGLILLPFLLPYYSASHNQGLTRSLSDAAMYSATWMDYLSTPSRLNYSWWSHRFFAATALFPGLIGLALTIFAILRGGALRDPRARMCLAIGVAGAVLSFGPRFPGYATLYGIFPLLQGIRAPARFGYLVTLAVAVVAGFGVVALRRTTPGRGWPAAAVLLLAAITAESLAAPLGLRRFDGIPPIYSHLPREDRSPVVEIPFFGPGSSQFHAPYMLNSTAHWRPILNGYSGFQAASYYDHAKLLQTFPDDPSMALLRELGVSHVFVHVDQVSAETMALVNARSELKVMETFGSIALYALN